MLKRLYANNYRCLVNFEIEFDALTLLMGANGGGKSSLFDLLYEIRRLLVDKDALGAKDKFGRELFSPRDLTAWADKSEQAFELDVLGNLPEIQPWLMELENACGDYISRTVLISHHPELIDYFGRRCGKWIERDPLGPARVKKFPDRIDDGLKLSDKIARGWEE
jgi:hypothetical protein